MTNLELARNVVWIGLAVCYIGIAVAGLGIIGSGLFREVSP